MGTYDDYQNALTAEKERDKNTGQPPQGGVQHTLANELHYLRGNPKQMMSQGGSEESIATIKERYGLDCPGAEHRNMMDWEQKQLERTDSWPSPIYGRSSFVYLGVDRAWRSENHGKFKKMWGDDIDQLERERVEFFDRASKSEVEERKYCNVMALVRSRILLALGAPLNGQDTNPTFIKALAAGFWGGAQLSPTWAKAAKKELKAESKRWHRLAEIVEKVENMQIDAWRKAGWGWQGDQKPKKAEASKEETRNEDHVDFAKVAAMPTFPSPLAPKSSFVTYGVDLAFRRPHYKKVVYPKHKELLDKLNAEYKHHRREEGSARNREEQYRHAGHKNVRLSILACLGSNDHMAARYVTSADVRNMAEGRYDKVNAQVNKELAEQPEKWEELAYILEDVEYDQLYAWREAGWRHNDETSSKTSQNVPSDDSGVTNSAGGGASASASDHVVTDSSVPMMIQHCLAHRNKWTEHENPAHHQRWNHVIELILAGEVENAAGYAKQWAAKGWSPWQELIQMLEKPND